MIRITTAPAVVITAVVTAAVILAATPRGAPDPGVGVGASPPANEPGTATPERTPVNYVGRLALEPTGGPAGTEVSLSGTGLDPDAELAIFWNTVRGSWVLKGEANEEFHGREFETVAQQLTTVRTDAVGDFTTTFTAPAGHGFNNDVTVERDGRLLNKAGFRLEPTVTITPESGPVGTPITIHMEGIGWDNLENSWLVTYDNKFTGLLSSVTTGGIATAVIPATGNVGTHVIRVVHGSFTVPYLNMQQSPRPDRPTFTLLFEVTPGDPVLPPAPASQGLTPEAGVPAAGRGPAIWTDPASATVGTPMAVHGHGFAAGAEVSLDWFTVVGNRVGGQGWDEASRALASVTADSDGSFVYASEVPDDLGGPHRIEAVVDGASLARTELTITPSAVVFSPSSGPVGTEIVIQLKGVGWTETANIYNFNYDNGYLGYACGFNSQGDVTIKLPATGEPGWHFIDIYPGIYKGKDVPGVQNFRIPQLTYEADHPGERLPAFRFAFEITP
jgi:hypothetical protein